MWPIVVLALSVTGPGSPVQAHPPVNRVCELLGPDARIDFEWLREVDAYEVDRALRALDSTGRGKGAIVALADRCGLTFAGSRGRA